MPSDLPDTELPGATPVCATPAPRPEAQGTVPADDPRRLAALGQLLGGVAHDFNNLLAVILGYADILAERLPQGSSERRMAEGILTAAERGAELTGQLLSFGRRQPLRPAPCDLNSVVAQIDRLLVRGLPGQIRLEFDLAPDLWLAHADSAGVESALVQLVLNACDAMPDGGVVRLVTANVPPGPVSSNRQVSLAVVDSGCGMDDATLAQACDPFFSTKGKGKGVGLGLCMVQGFARDSGGEMAIDSRPGLGTTVALYLPVADDHA